MTAAAPRLLLFDDGLGDFGPLSDLRASFELRTGVRTTMERAGAADALLVPEALAALVAERHALPVNQFPAGDDILLLNGRWRIAAASRELLEPGEALVEEGSGHLMAARFDRRQAEAWWRGRTLPAGVKARPWPHRSLAARPWDLLHAESLAGLMADDIRELHDAWRAAGTLAPAPAGAIVIPGSPVVIHAEASILPGTILDAASGPILVGPGAVIRPGAVLVGPVSVGARSVVQERSLLKARTVVGPGCRVAGEIGGTIFQGHSNKAHEGHLGDSLVGEWVNLGAGTTNSNLLNTYGEVLMRLRPDGALEATGRQFMGSVIGDHVKTAICTRLMTGCVLGTGAMVACTPPPPQAVGRFAWLVDQKPGAGAEAARTQRLDRFLRTAGIVMARRGVTPGPALVAALTRLHAAGA